MSSIRPHHIHSLCLVPIIPSRLSRWDDGDGRVVCGAGLRLFVVVYQSVIARSVVIDPSSSVPLAALSSPPRNNHPPQLSPSSSYFYSNLPRCHQHASEWCQVVVGSTFIGRLVFRGPWRTDVATRLVLFGRRVTGRPFLVDPVWSPHRWAGCRFSAFRSFPNFLPFGPNLRHFDLFLFALGLLSSTIPLCVASNCFGRLIV